MDLKKIGAGIGLFINRPGSDDVSLFAYTDEAVIENVKLVAADITGKDYAGGLVDSMIALSYRLSLPLIARDREINNVIEHLYEDNVAGKLSDDRFMKMSKRYEEEQSELAKLIRDLKARFVRKTTKL